MTDDHIMSEQEWGTWKRLRPKSVQDLIDEFPYGSPVLFVDATVFVVGWSEHDTILVSPADPYSDFDASRENIRELTAGHLREHAFRLDRKQ